MIDDKNICILLKCITTEIGKKKNTLFSKYGITGFQSDILAFLYRNIDKETDVLSFPMGENGVYDTNPETGAQILGDVVISMEKARDQAELFGHSLQREVGYLTAHSVLHLLGYDHMEKLERVRMREKEELVMEQLGLPASSSYIVDDDMA